jgi:hypothetical protein
VTTAIMTLLGHLGPKWLIEMRYDALRRTVFTYYVQLRFGL